MIFNSQKHLILINLKLNQSYFFYRSIILVEKVLILIE